MPIRLNLLAEEQALEDLRRRDPVKRAIWVGALAVAAMLVWSSSLWVKALVIKSDLAALQKNQQLHADAYSHVQDNQKKIAEVNAKLAALDGLATNRFLVGNLLNALQQTTVDGVQLMRVRLDFNYALTEEVKATRAGGKSIPARPATATEKILLTLEAKDSSTVPGDAIQKYQRKLANAQYFQNSLGKADDVRLKDYGTAQTGLDGKRFLLFTLECRYPDKTR